MKFAIAAGFLAQTIPVVADGSSGLLSNAKQLKLQLQNALLQDHAGQQDPDQPSLRFQAIKASRTKKRIQRFPAGQLKNNPADVVVFSSTPDLAFEMEYCDPASEDPDVGVLSCGRGRVCKASQKSLLGGVCAERTTKKKSPGGKNKAKKEGKSHLSFKTLTDRAASFSARPSVADAKACDPESDDPDVGMLSCGPDSFCESRPASVLGGLCVAPGPSSRALQAAQILCDNLACDCSGYDISTGTGDVVCEYRVCLDTFTPGSCSDQCCIDTCSNNSVELNVVKDSLTSQLCYDFTDPYPQELCLSLNVDYSDGLVGCSTTFDGQDCLCEVTYTPDLVPLFDCSAVGGPVANEMVDTPPVFLLPIVESCYEYEYGPPCDLCDIPEENYNIVVGDGITCANIVNLDGTLREDNPDCPLFQDVAKASCCPEIVPPPPGDGPPCPLCELYIPKENYNIVVGEVGDGITCDVIDAYVYVDFALSEDSPYCPQFQELAKAYCCYPQCKLCGATGYMDPALFSSTVSIPTLGDYTCEVFAIASYTLNTLSDTDVCSGYQVLVRGPCCSDIAESTVPIGAPGPGPTMSPTSPNPAMIDPVVPTTDAPSDAPYPPCKLCGATGYMDPALFSSTVSIPTVGEYTCEELASAAYTTNTLNPIECGGWQVYVRGPCCSDIAGSAGSDSTVPIGAPGPGTSMSPTSPSPAMIDPAPSNAPSDANGGLSKPSDANGGLSKQAVASFLGTTTSLALFFLS